MYPLASLCGLWAAPEATRRGANLPPLVPAPSKVTQHKARHVSSRTKDTVFENVVFELEDARDELAAHPWLKPALFAPPAQRVPLQLRQAQRALHFLGLLKLRVAPELPLELWHEIVRHVFSCETSAAQVLRVGSRLELVAFPALPPEAELELLAAALQKRTGPSDVALLDSFCRRPARHAAALADATAPEAPEALEAPEAPEAPDAAPDAPEAPDPAEAPEAPEAPDAAAPGSLQTAAPDAPSQAAHADGSVRSSLALSLGGHMRVRLSLTLETIR